MRRLHHPLPHSEILVGPAQVRNDLKVRYGIDGDTIEGDLDALKTRLVALFTYRT
jgi:hypothetical protein